MLEKIRLKGSFEFNTNSIYNNGELIVARRPNTAKKRSTEHYVPCTNCHSFFSKITLYRHYRRCIRQSKSKLLIHTRNIQKNGRILANRVHWRANQIVATKICPLLLPGLISSTIRYDELIILYGNKLTCKYRQPYLMYHIRQVLRTLSRFLITIKEIEPEIEDLKSVYQPKYYNSVLAAVNKLAKLNVNTNEYEVPSLATRLGNYLKKCGELLATECIKSCDTERRALVKDF